MKQHFWRIRAIKRIIIRKREKKLAIANRCPLAEITEPFNWRTASVLNKSDPFRSTQCLSIADPKPNQIQKNSQFKPKQYQIESKSKEIILTYRLSEWQCRKWRIYSLSMERQTAELTMRLLRIQRYCTRKKTTLSESWSRHFYLLRL